MTSLEVQEKKTELVTLSAAFRNFRTYRRLAPKKGGSREKLKSLRAQQQHPNTLSDVANETEVNGARLLPLPEQGKATSGRTGTSEQQTATESVNATLSASGNAVNRRVLDSPVRAAPSRSWTEQAEESVPRGGGDPEPPVPAAKEFDSEGEREDGGLTN